MNYGLPVERHEQIISISNVVKNFFVLYLCFIINYFTHRIIAVLMGTSKGLRSSVVCPSLSQTPVQAYYFKKKNLNRKKIFVR